MRGSLEGFWAAVARRRRRSEIDRIGQGSDISEGIRNDTRMVLEIRKDGHFRIKSTLQRAMAQPEW